MAVAFGLMLVLALAQGIVALAMLDQVSSGAASLSDSWLPSVRLIGATKSAAAKIRVAEQAEILASTVREMKAAEKTVEAAMTEYGAAEREYGTLSSTPEQRALKAKFDEQWKTYLNFHQQIVDLSHDDKDLEAKILLKGNSETAYQKAIAALDELVQLDGKGAQVASEAARAANSMAKTVIAVVIVAVLGVAVGSAVVITRLIATPLNELNGVMRQLADGNLLVKVPSSERKDEIGQMAGTVEVFKNSALERVRMEEAEKRELARREERRQKVEKLAGDFDRTVTGVLNVVTSANTELEATAQSMSAIALQTNRQVTIVVAASEEASSGVQTVAAAAEELSKSIEEISRQVTQSTRISQAASEEAGKTDATVKGLAESSRQDR